MGTMKKIEDNSIQLIVTSPPYNKAWYSNVPDNAIWKGAGISYDKYEDKMPPTDYSNLQREVIQEMLRILKPTGSIFYNHKDIIYNGRIVHPSYIYDFPIHQVIVWNRQNSPMISTRYYLPITEYFFWIVKDPQRFFFSRKDGIFSSTIWTCNACSNNPHPAPFPERIVSSIINSCSKEGDIVYDPYMGSGTTALCACDLKRHYIGSEISQKYVNESYGRLCRKQQQLTMF